MINQVKHKNRINSHIFFNNYFFLLHISSAQNVIHVLAIYMRNKRFQAFDRSYV